MAALFQYHLADEALAELQKLDVAAFTALRERNPAAAAQAFELQLTLLLLKGEIGKLREGLTGSDGVSGGLFFQIRLAAATGDYAEADELLATVQTEAAARNGLGGVGFLLGRFLLDQAPLASGVSGNALSAITHVLGTHQIQRDMQAAGQPGPALVAIRPRDCIREAHTFAAAPMRRESELALLRGWLALECGNNREAAAQFRTALTRRWPPSQALGPLLTVGRTHPLETVCAIQGIRQFDYGPLFSFRGEALAALGLRWLESPDK